MAAVVMLLVGLASLTGSASARAPDAAAVMRRMKAALEPERPSVRQMTFRISGAEGPAAQLVVGQARKAGRILMVVLAPETLRGIAYLVQEGAGDRNVQWLYLPVIGRVRELISPEAYAAFLNSDFTYADLGFADMRARYRMLGAEKIDGTQASVIEGVPKETWYYARTVTSIAADSSLPLERKFYDPANRLWKVERWAQVSVIDGVPTTLQVSMEDVQARTRTDIDVSAVRYDVDIPESLVDPSQLPKAAAASIWADLGSLTKCHDHFATVRHEGDQCCR